MKQPNTEKSKEEINHSLKKMVILAELLNYENQVELIDTKFKIPILNNFAKRIISDCTALKQHLKNSGRVSVTIGQDDDSEEYIGALWVILDKLCMLDLELLTEYAKDLSGTLKELV